MPGTLPVFKGWRKGQKTAKEETVYKEAMKFKHVKEGQFFYAIHHNNWPKYVVRKPKSIGDKFIAALDNDRRQQKITWAKYLKTGTFFARRSNDISWSDRDFDSDEEVLPAAPHSYKYLSTKEALKLKKQLGNKRSWKYGISL